MKDSNDVNPIVTWFIKYEILSNREAENGRVNLLAGTAYEGISCKNTTGIINFIQHPVGSVKVIVSDVVPDIDQVSLCLRTAREGRHGLLAAPFVLESATRFGFHGFDVKCFGRAAFAADADGIAKGFQLFLSRLIPLFKQTQAFRNDLIRSLVAPAFHLFFNQLFEVGWQ